MAPKGIRRRLKAAKKHVDAEIRGNASGGGIYARGLAAEGYAGGYRDCLNDISKLLDGVEPNRRGYWELAPV